MAFVFLKAGPEVPVTLHLTSEPVTFLAPGVRVEVPDGYVTTLTNDVLTAPYVIREAVPEVVHGDGGRLGWRELPGATPSRPAWWEIKDWFRLSDYEVFSDLDAAGWAHILRQMAVNGYESGDPDSNEPFRKDVNSWWRYRGDARPYDFLRSVDPRSTALGRAPLTELKLAMQLDEDGEIIGVVRDQEPFSLGFDEVFPVLKVDMSCPDALLVEAFTIFVKEKRKAVPLNITKRGRAASLTPAISEQFRVWADYRIVAVHDVDFWAWVRNRAALDTPGATGVPVSSETGKPRASFVASVVFPDLPASFNPEQHVSKARSLLASALELADVVGVQARAVNH